MFSIFSPNPAKLAEQIFNELDLPVSAFSHMQEKDYKPYKDKLEQRIAGLSNLSKKEVLNLLVLVCEHIKAIPNFYSYIACQDVAFCLKYDLEIKIYGSYDTHEAKCDRELINSSPSLS